MIDNPFLNRNPNIALVTPPFMSAGQGEILHSARQLGRQLTEVAFIGSDETVSYAIQKLSLDSLAEEYREDISVLQQGVDRDSQDPESGRHIVLPSLEPGLQHRDLVLGWAAIYTWED